MSTDRAAMVARTTVLDHTKGRHYKNLIFLIFFTSITIAYS